MKNFPPVFEKDEMMKSDLITLPKVKKHMSVNSYTNWCIPPKDAITQEVKRCKEITAQRIKMDSNSQYQLLKFLMRVV